jgi:peptidoglycan/xylan/chitin deacetylase (PgdA/CDA1 family)
MTSRDDKLNSEEGKFEIVTASCELAGLETSEKDRVFHRKKIPNVLSIDLESWVHRDEVHGEDIRKRLDNGFVLRSVRHLLDILEKYGVRTTFFVVSEIYDWYPATIHEIRRKGHEIAHHTHTHRLLRNRKQLLNELKESRRFIDEFGPKGFRAPKIFLTRDSVKTLRDYGFNYDSSVYGPWELCQEVDGILEVPITSYPLHGVLPMLSFPRGLLSCLKSGEIPIGSGLCLGLFGAKMQDFFLKINSMNRPMITFIHPWQLWSTPVRISFRRIGVVPYLIKSHKIVQDLLAKFEFTTIADLENVRRH